MNRKKKEMKRVKMLSGELLSFEVVEKRVAREMIIKNHYSHSWYHTFGILNIGVRRGKELLGVASFGSMKVPKAQNIIKGLKKEEIIELNRLWIDDALGKNAESMLIGISFWFIKELLPKVKVIQSFADGRVGCGIIYQATNFGYYGFHETEFLVNKDGRAFHEQVFHTSSRPLVITRNLEALQERFRLMTTKTYRYLYFLDKKYEKLCSLKKEPYPKETTTETYEDYLMDVSRHERYIANTCNYLFYKTGQKAFTFSLDGVHYRLTREEYENGTKPQDKIKEVPLRLF